MRSYRQTLIVIAAAALWSLPASAGRGDSGFELASSDVESLSYDADGRIANRLVEHYTAAGEARGSTLFVNTWTARRLARTERVHRTMDGSTVNRMVTTWRYLGDGRTKTRGRVWTDGVGETTRTERAQWDYTADDGSTLITTVVRKGDGSLIETRYTILRNRRGVNSSDTSVFDAQGVQTSRHLSEYQGNVTERWTFDETDEITRYERQVQSRDASNRVQRVDVEIQDGRKQSLGARTTEFFYSARSRQVQRQVTTWYGPDELATQRQTTSYAYENGVRTFSRVRWERWTSDLTD